VPFIRGGARIIIIIIADASLLVVAGVAVARTTSCLRPCVFDRAASHACAAARAVQRVVCNGATQVLQVQPDLVRAAGDWLTKHQGLASAARQQRDACLRGLALNAASSSGMQRFEDRNRISTIHPVHFAAPN
jgi:hypothetical protein